MSEIVQPSRWTRPGASASVSAPVDDPVVSSDMATGFRILGVVGAATALAVPLLPDIGPLCPLRRLTGIPCPLCGGTTAAIELTRGDLVGALSASPLALVVIVAVVAAWISWLLVRLGFLSRQPTVSAGVSAKVSVPILGVSWLFQMHRFGHL